MKTEENPREVRLWAKGPENMGKGARKDLVPRSTSPLAVSAKQAVRVDDRGPRWRWTAWLELPLHQELVLNQNAQVGAFR